MKREVSQRLRSVGELAETDGRGNNSTKAISPSMVSTNPRTVSNSVCLLESERVVGNIGGCALGSCFCRWRLLLALGFFDIGID